MKKKICVLLSAIMLMSLSASLVGCGGGGDTGAEATTTAAEATTAAG